jgi:hypothetical protein
MMGINDFLADILKVLAVQPDSDESRSKAAAKMAKAEDNHEGSSAGTSSAASSATTSRGASSMKLASSDPWVSLHRSTPSASSGMMKPKYTDTPASSHELSRASTQTLDSATSVLRSTSSGDVSRVNYPRSLLAALRNLADSSSSRSPSRNRSQSGFGRSNSQSKTENTHPWGESADPPNPINTIYSTSKGITKIIDAGINSHKDLCLGVSKMFSNLPKFYSDEGRQTSSVTGIKSGLQTAGQVDFPFPQYGIIFLLTMMQEVELDIHKETQKPSGRSVNDDIIAARRAQGQEAWRGIGKEFQTEIVYRCLRVYEEVKRRKAVGGDYYNAVPDFLDKEKEKSRKLVHGIHSQRSPNCPITGHEHRIYPSTLDLQSPDSSQGGSITWMRGAAEELMRPSRSTSHLEHVRSFPQPSSPSHQDDDEETQYRTDLDEAIRKSIQECSTRDTEDDRAIKCAIRASIAELHRSGVSAPNEPTVEKDKETQIRFRIQESMIHDNMKKSASKRDGKDPDINFVTGNHDEAGTDRDKTPPEQYVLRESRHTERDEGLTFYRNHLARVSVLT